MNNLRTDLLMHHLDTVKAMIFDGDGTVWKGSVSKGIGMGYLMQSATGLDVRAFKSLVRGAVDISRKISKNEDPECLAKGLEELYSILVKNNLGTQSEMMAFAASYLSKYTIPNMRYLMYAMSSARPLFLITISGSTSALAARNSLPFTDFVSNEDIFDISGKLKGVNLIVRNGEDKAARAQAMLEKYDLNIRDCAAFGDGTVDLPMLKAAKISVASPYAEDAIKGETDFVMEL